MTRSPVLRAASAVRRSARAARTAAEDRADRRLPRPSPAALLEGALPPPTRLDQYVRGVRTTAPGAPWPAGRPAEIVTRLSESDPSWAARTVTAAERIAAGRLRILGADDAEVTADGVPGPRGRFAWHCDATSGYAWDPGRYYKAVPIPVGRADVKVPWEMSRCQHLPTLAMAYLVSGEARYGEAVAEHLDDWIEQNPVRRGVNWACTMDVAIRAVNWIWVHDLLSGSPALTDELEVRLLASLVEHARHVAGNIEVYEHGITTNHTAADWSGLLHLSLLLAGLPEATGWQAQAIGGLECCIAEQVNGDGWDFEGSTSYHRLALELFLGPYLRLRRAGRRLSPGYEQRLRSMFGAIAGAVRPDGMMPLLGDADDGRLQILHDYFGWVPQDHRYLLAVGGALFDEAAWLEAGLGAPGGTEELAWQLGEVELLGSGRTATSKGPGPIAAGSTAFRDTGRYVLRRRGHYALVNADPVGTRGLGNHHHNHWLAYELCLAGKPVAVDPGTFTYTKDPGVRDAFRSTRAHNTVMVDGEEQCELTGYFAVGDTPPPTVLEFSTGGESELLVAEHGAYERLQAPVRHRRTCLFMPERAAFVVLDELAGAQSHEMESFLHLAPGSLVEAGRPEGDRTIGATLGAIDAELRRLAGPLTAWRPDDALTVSCGEVAVLVVPLGPSAVTTGEGAVSARYGQQSPAPVITFSSAFDGLYRGGYGLIALLG